MLVTHTPATSPATSLTWASAWTGPRRQARAASCSRRSGAVDRRRCGTLARASTLPAASAATAFTAVVPMSMPTVTGPAAAPPVEPDTVVMIGHYE